MRGRQLHVGCAMHVDFRRDDTRVPESHNHTSSLRTDARRSPVECIICTAGLFTPLCSSSLSYSRKCQLPSCSIYPGMPNSDVYARHPTPRLCSRKTNARFSNDLKQSLPLSTAFFQSRTLIFLASPKELLPPPNPQDSAVHSLLHY